ncbi:MAG TPA: caspase family protein, partial [Polyangiales bacterium]|nr:caspase family protein [Polyangiales bacterium]
MRAGAIVVGIDKYATPAWELNGAVRDAIAFARWATAAGGVSVGDLTLLLSRSEDSEPVPDELAPAVEQASKAAINAVLSSFKVKNAGDGLDRLWFFYAGHGLSAPGETPAAGPLLVPADVDDIDVYLSEGPIGVESFRNAMQDQPPREQIYLVDACRDALPLQGNKLPTQGYFWDVARIKNDMLATQGVLLATTAGQRAKEIRGRGAFSKVLLSGLKGLGPDLDAPPSPAPGQRPRPCVGFDKLVDFVKYALERELGDKDLQVPYGTLNKIGARLSIADFAPNDLPRAKITFIVRPGDARPTGKLHFLLWSEQDWDWIPRDRNPAPCGPPLQEEVSVTITGGTHYVQVLANGFDAFNMPLRVYDDRRFPVELQPATTFERKSMLESVAAPAPATNATHSLTVEASDRLARVCIVDPAGRELARDYHTVTRTGLVPGMYRIVAELAGRDRVEKKVQVPTDRQIVGLDLTAPAPNPQVVDSLHMAGIGVGAFSEPSEAFGRIAGARLSSILAYAAWGARWPDGSPFYKLR